MNRNENPPIQRHPALAPLSRDHYAGLVQAQHLIKAGDTTKALAVDRRQAVAEFLDVWAREIRPHFEDEEQLLGELLAADDRKQMRDEHQALYSIADALRALRKEIDPDPATLVKAGTLLNNHIRWEERELFGRLQNDLTEDQLAQLQKRTTVLEESRPRNIHRSCDKPTT